VGSVSEENHFVQIGEHNHTENKEATIKAKVSDRIKTACSKENFNNLKIVTEVTKTLNDEELKHIPRFKSLMDKCIKMKKKKIESFNSRFDDIPDFLQRDLQGQKFLQFDKGAGVENRFIILFSKKICLI
jgi:superfamily I DNA/RNA helicase